MPPAACPRVGSDPATELGARATVGLLALHSPGPRDRGDAGTVQATRLVAARDPAGGVWRARASGSVAKGGSFVITRRASLLTIAMLWFFAGTTGCSDEGGGTDAGATSASGPGTVVAELPPGMIALALGGNEAELHVVGGRTYPDGGVELSIFRIRNGSIEPEALPSNLDWSDYFLGDDLTLGIRFNALPQAGYLLGFYVVTVVPFDGSPSRLLFRPELDVDGGLFVLPDGGLLPSSLYPQAFQVEADGTVLVAYWDLRTYSADACSIGQYTPSDEWRELVEISERCAFHTLLLANASTLYVTTESSLWRVDRETGSAVLLLTGLDLGGFNAIDTLAESDGSLVFNRLNGRGADLDQLGPDGGLHPLETFGGTDPFLSALGADGPSIYVLSQGTLRRRLPSGGFEILAQAGSTGLFGLPGYDYTRLILGDAGVYMTYLEATDAGVRSTVRSVPR